MRVNGRKVDIPSFEVKPGDVITISEKMKNNPQVIESFNSRPPELVPPYLQQNRENMSGQLLKLPNREEIPVNIDEALIVEFYAK